MKYWAFFLIVFPAGVFCLNPDLVQKVNNTFGVEGSAPLIEALKKAEDSGIPLGPLENKVWEGLAKGKPFSKIMKAVDIRRGHLSSILARNQGKVPHDFAAQLFSAEASSSLDPTQPKKISPFGQVKKGPENGQKMAPNHLSPPKWHKGSASKVRLDRVEKRLERGISKQDRKIKGVERKIDRREHRRSKGK